MAYLDRFPSYYHWKLERASKGYFYLRKLVGRQNIPKLPDYSLIAISLLWLARKLQTYHTPGTLCPRSLQGLHWQVRHWLYHAAIHALTDQVFSERGIEYTEITWLPFMVIRQR